MSSFFNVSALGGNPFATPVGQRIENATDAALASENWALNMEICDFINESSETARDAMKAIRKRLTQNAGKNYTVILYTLTVLETCVKNCGKPFHLLVAQKEFIQELVKLIGPKNDPPAVVQEKVLNLIQIWADAFRSQADLTGVVQVYSELKNKGIEFPAADPETMAPIYTPQRSVPESHNHPGQVPLPTSPQHQLIAQQPAAPAVTVPVVAGGPAVISREQISKLQSELEIVNLNMTVFAEMLSELRPGQEDPADYKLLTELAVTCHEMQGRIVDLIGRVTHDSVTAELLRLNDELNNLFLRHQRYEKNRDPRNTEAGPAALLGAAMGVPTATKTGLENPPRDSLIDFNDDTSADQHLLSTQLSGLGIATASSQLSNISGVNAQHGAIGRDVDEFDMLAQSRNTDVAAIPSQSAANTPKKEPNTNSNSEFEEIAAWLDKEIVEEDGPEESLTSKEFDRFLAERAAAADSLPTITSQTGPTSGTSRPKKASKKEEESLMDL